ncbi:MAG TPA: squalene/phytoene synthase family protein, partial [bacterium]|nr:squalene/phytoene synthase family protein [bacterium]
MTQGAPLNLPDGPLRQKTSFYYALLLLPRRRRLAMETLYRFCWAADEVSDGPGTPAQKRKDLAAFRAGLTACLAGRPRGPLFTALRRVVEEFHLSAEPLRRTVAGVERDLRPLKFRAFAELHRYARQVAGGPGLSSMEIFGFRDPAHRLYAENLGVFLQIVNIVRDYREDLALGRQYLPQEDFRRFGLHPDRLDPRDLAWRPFVEFQLDRALGFLDLARHALTRRQRAGLATAEAIAAVYGRLERKLRARPQAILAGKVSLSPAEKLAAVGGALWRCARWRVWP